MALTLTLLPAKAYNAPLLKDELKAALPITSDGNKTNRLDGVLRMYAVLIDPQPGDEAAAVGVAEAHDSKGLSTAQQTRAAIGAAVKKTEGKAWDDLTPTDVRALLAALLNERFMLEDDGTVKQP